VPPLNAAVMRACTARVLAKAQPSVPASRRTALPIVNERTRRETNYDDHDRGHDGPKERGFEPVEAHLYAFAFCFFRLVVLARFGGSSL